MSTAASLAALLSSKADKNFYTQVLMYWNAKYEANQEKLEKQVKYEEKFNNAYDSALDNTNELKASFGGCEIIVGKNNTNEQLAESYARAKVKNYDEELKKELEELDTEYDTMKTMYETLLTELDAEIQSEKELVSKNAQDTNLLSS